ncbi:hypothetical protein RHMOL_Rhmol05G0252500 [Rhododendron molle]|uniref:Uncharacterized protein n=1 Tax=Rhododendron molle TaxID=49168 RepID=A0ACC0NUJ2_RHOML|nr:hypothetical protein RHMOL_Rhmol05G0252500 [Rhododendron molle]
MRSSLWPFAASCDYVGDVLEIHPVCGVNEISEKSEKAAVGSLGMTLEPHAYKSIIGGIERESFENSFSKQNQIPKKQERNDYREAPGQLLGH